MDRSLIFFTAAIFSLLCGVSCKHSSDASDSDAEVKVIKGRDASSKEYGEVVFLGLNHDPTFCTGTVIGHNAVITAAHCVSQNMLPRDITAINAEVIEKKWFQSDSEVPGVRNSSVTIDKKVDRIHELPWNKQIHGLDLAVVHFPDHTFASWFHLAKAPMKQGEIYIAGYGYDSLNKKQPSIFRRREGSNSIASLSRTLYSFPAPSSSDAKLKYEVVEVDQETGKRTKISKSRSGPAHGDSGGPMFVWTADKKSKNLLGTCVGMVQQTSKDVIRVIYTNLHSKESLDLLRTAQSRGAEIAGLNEVLGVPPVDALPEEWFDLPLPSDP